MKSEEITDKIIQILKEYSPNIRGINKRSLGYNITFTNPARPSAYHLWVGAKYDKEEKKLIINAGRKPEIDIPQDLIKYISDMYPQSKYVGEKGFHEWKNLDL